MATSSEMTRRGSELLYPDSSPSGTSKMRTTDTKAEIEQLQKLAKLMDSAVEIPLIKRRVGLDSLIGLIPGIGDAATSAISGFIVLKALNLGARKRTLAKMIGNIGVDFVLGSIPLVGDLFDVAFKANSKNVELLLRELGKSPTHNASS